MSQSNGSNQRTSMYDPVREAAAQYSNTSNATLAQGGDSGTTHRNNPVRESAASASHANPIGAAEEKAKEDGATKAAGDEREKELMAAREARIAGVAMDETSATVFMNSTLEAMDKELSGDIPGL